MKKYGRLPRIHDPRVPKYAALVAGKALPPLPAPVNYSTGMPADLGEMLNDQIGDCVPAGFGHARQVWSFNANAPMVTPSDADIEKFYELAGGYVPGNPNTDNGCIEQVALMEWLNNPIDDNQLAAFVEIDVSNMADVKRAIWESGCVFIGLVVPSFLQNLESPGSIWAANPRANNSIIGGHAVIVVGWDARDNLIIISWGSVYTMTASFWSGFVDEAYALANRSWIEKTGMSPAGMSLTALESLMQSMKVPTQPVEHEHRHHRRWKRKRGGGNETGI